MANSSACFGVLPLFVIFKHITFETDFFYPSPRTDVFHSPVRKFCYLPYGLRHDRSARPLRQILPSHRLLRLPRLVLLTSLPYWLYLLEFRLDGILRLTYRSPRLAWFRPQPFRC